MIIDCYLNKHQIQEIEKNVVLTPHAERDIADCFEGEKPQEFYQGLLSGYYNSFLLMQKLPPHQAQEYIKGILRYLTQQLQKTDNVCKQ
ncbi:MAG: hypothetical protein N3B18_02245 [Desulfobacterota bacterium]|nr:hypothetical protein [Thermodesulfobacteriota bacterium]